MPAAAYAVRSTMMIDHVPQGDPCEACGERALSHRPEHKPKGDPCKLCGLAASRHRVRTRHQASKMQTVFIGADGEGQGRKDHKYVLLAASTEDGTRAWWVTPKDPPTQDANGFWHYKCALTTKQCLDFMLEFPQHNTKTFAYAFNYDLTKILVDLPDHLLYLLFRPELRARVGAEALKGPRPIKWEGYRINLQGSKFTIAKGNRRKVIWDVWKFYQSSFVNALKEWKVGTEEELERMALMKSKRGEFDKESPEDVLKYCLSECRKMAELARKLVEAHEAAGLKLRSFYGAGSTAAAMLSKMGIKDKIRPAPKDMTLAVASGFFGGRFENSVIGEFNEPIWNYDISSAYPYQLCFLPCLLHGVWEHTTKRIDIEGPTVRAALVRYTLGPKQPTPLNHMISWGPFPFRENDGSICFPITSGGGWVWDEEYLTGECHFPNVQFQEAWIYKTACTCNPFTDIPKYYLERLRIGKEGPGIVIKLGMNSNYGKLAQSVGKGQFNNWVWAGLITSRTRAQLMEAAHCSTDLANIYMMATDGIFSRERLTLPKPKDTETDIPVTEVKTGKVTQKPLGGWEETPIPQGIFIARPGIYFPLNPTEKQLKQVKARGLGKANLYENHEKIRLHWHEYGHHLPVDVSNITRFCGAKTSISRAGPEGQYTYNRASETPNGERRSGPDEREAAAAKPRYGQWITRKVSMSFRPMPKRSDVNPDGKTLKLRELPPELVSMPYKKATKSIDRIALERATLEMTEQPDGDLSDYEIDES